MALDRNGRPRRITPPMSALVVASLALASSASAQTGVTQTARAQDRQDPTAQEVAALRTLLQEHTDRLERLERAIARLRADSAAGCLTLTDPTDVALGWRSDAIWDCIRPGMSERDVIEILGKPSRVSPESMRRALHYEGDVDGRGALSGSVTIEEEEDRVVRIVRPTVKSSL